MTPGSWNELSLGNETKTFLASDSRTVHIVCSSQENGTVKFYLPCLDTLWFTVPHVVQKLTLTCTLKDTEGGDRE